MIVKILISLAALFALYWQIRMQKTFPTIITIGLIVGILMVLLSFNPIHTSGFYVYMGFVALAFIYGMTVKEKTIWARLIIILMSATIFTYWLWVLSHWHGNELLLPIFTLLVGFSGVISRVKLKNELGFLTILAVDAIAIILEHWMKTR